MMTEAKAWKAAYMALERDVIQQVAWFSTYGLGVSAAGQTDIGRDIMRRAGTDIEDPYSLYAALTACRKFHKINPAIPMTDGEITPAA